jgi:hypothetical protein
MGIIAGFITTLVPLFHLVRRYKQIITSKVFLRMLRYRQKCRCSGPLRLSAVDK